MKKLLLAVIVALLTATGIVIPEKYVDAFVTLFIPTVTASEFHAVNQAWVAYPYQFKCDWYCTCPPVRQIASVEALRPSPTHHSVDRSSDVAFVARPMREFSHVSR